MSIAALYRTWVPTVARWSYLDNGINEEVYNEFKYYKGNIQPFKRGFGVEDTSSGSLVFNEYLLLYTREEVDFEQPSGIPSGATNITLMFKWFYVDGRWYTILGDENWTRGGRAPKHFKYSGEYQSGQGYVGEDVGDPVPLPELVSEFEAIVSELNQVSNLYV